MVISPTRIVKKSCLVTSDLSPTQQRLLSFLRDFIAKNEFSPTIAEIKDSLNLTSSSGVQDNLQKLVDWGFIERLSGCRNVRLLESLPLKKIDTGKVVDKFSIPQILLNKRSQNYILEIVETNLLPNTQIGDRALLKKIVSLSEIKDGDIIHGMIGDVQVMGRYQIDNSNSWLVSNSNKYSLIEKNARIQGLLVGICRKY